MSMCLYGKRYIEKPLSILPGITVYRCHLPLKEELVIGIDDDRLKIGGVGYQAQVALLTGGGVEGLHSQPAVDEGHDDITVTDLLLAVNETDVTVEDAESGHRLPAHTHKIHSLWVMHELLIQIKPLMTVVGGRGREACRQPVEEWEMKMPDLIKGDEIGTVDGIIFIHRHHCQVN